MKHFKQKTLAVCISLTISACGGGGGGGSDSGGSSGSGGSGGSGNQTYTVSGTVSGLNDGAVAVSNGGSGKTDVDNSTRFSYDLPSGSSYDILIETNPLEQLCRVENGSGSNLQGNVDNITVSCAPVATAPTCTGLADSDGDTLSDCAELETHLTNPWLSDTDGDSYPDGREAADFDPNNNPYIFNPRVADMATIAVDLTAVPEIDLDFTESSGSSRNVSTSYEQSESNSISRDWGGETSRQLEVGHTLSVSTTQTVGAEVNVSPTDLGGSVSYESSLTLGFESSVSQTRGSSVNWSNSAAEENSQAYSETVALTEEQGSTYSGGYLRVTARIRNEGHIPYDLENLTLSAVLFDPKRPFDIESIGTMEFTDGGFPLTSILSGESAPLNFSTDLTLGKAQQLLRDSENIVIMPGTYRLLDIEDRSLLLVDRDVSARTAEIVIDYGIDAAREEKHRVSVNRGDGSRFISLADALQDVLDLSITEGAGSWVFGTDSSASTTSPGLLGVGSYAMDNTANRYWLIAHNRNDGGSRTTDYYNLLLEGYDLNQIQLRADDKVSLVYVGDSDRDGLSDRNERELGTDRDAFDTDGDGLGDGLEAYGWLTNFASAPCDQGNDLSRVFGNPLLADSDEDGTDDRSEREACLNPSFNFIAEAGEEQIVNKNSEVTLSAASVQSSSGSSPVYTWNLLSGPSVLDANGDTVTQLSGRRPTFTAPDDVSSLLWELSISMGGETQMDRTVVQVQENRSDAVYVGIPHPTASADGTRDAPYASLSEALQSLSPGEDLYVMTQTDPYTLVNALNIPDGTSLYGGYSENWVRNVESNRTRIVRDTTSNPNAISIASVTSDMWFSGFSVYANGDNTNALASTEHNVVALSIDGDANTNAGVLSIEDNTFEASAVKSGRSSSPGSSYAVKAIGLSNFRLIDNTLIAGSGGFGSAGSPGSQGTKGDDANSGSRSGGSGSGSGGNGGTGGTGNSGPLIGSWSGNRGTDGGPSSSGGDGGAGGTYSFGCVTSGNPRVGDPGANGSPGTDGANADTPIYELFAQEFFTTVASNGGNGGHGRGGGGGGGGQACDVGAGGGNGGGGGQGGSGGTRGTGGSSGGASIGLWLSEVLSADIRGNNITSATGGSAGAGGRGGNRGERGQYSSGRSGSTNIANVRGRTGARGGWGGYGGRGGHGGGGAGGPSFGIFVGPDLAPLLFNNSITAGSGGSGGFSYGNAGDGGDSYSVFDADPSDGSSPEVDTSNSLTGSSAGAAGGTSTGGTQGAPGSAGTTNF